MVLKSNSEEFNQRVSRVNSLRNESRSWMTKLPLSTTSPTPAGSQSPATAVAATSSVTSGGRASKEIRRRICVTDSSDRRHENDLPDSETHLNSNKNRGNYTESCGAGCVNSDIQAACTDTELSSQRQEPRHQHHHQRRASLHGDLPSHRCAQKSLHTDLPFSLRHYEHVKTSSAAAYTKANSTNISNKLQSSQKIRTDGLKSVIARETAVSPDAKLEEDEDSDTAEETDTPTNISNVMSQDVYEDRYADIHTVTLQHCPGENLGFSIRGGIEKGKGIFVAHVDSDGQAENQGLKQGDRILKVNNVSFGELTHAEAVRAIQSSAKLRLLVTSSEGYKMPGKTGMIQVHDSAQLRTVQVLADDDGYLGLSFIGGNDMGTDVVISNVEPDSPAQRAGLQRGDLIIKLNGENMRHLSHMEIVLLFSSSPEVELLVKSAELNTKKSVRDQLDAKLAAGFFHNYAVENCQPFGSSVLRQEAWQSCQDYGIHRNVKKLHPHMRRDSSLSSDMDTSVSSECDSYLDSYSKQTPGILKFHLDKQSRLSILSKVNEISFTDPEDEDDDEEIPVTVINTVDPAEFGFEPLTFDYDHELQTLDTGDAGDDRHHKERLSPSLSAVPMSRVRDIANMFELRAKKADQLTKSYAHRWKNLKESSSNFALGDYPSSQKGWDFLSTRAKCQPLSARSKNPNQPNKTAPNIQSENASSISNPSWQKSKGLKKFVDHSVKDRTPVSNNPHSSKGQTSMKRSKSAEFTDLRSRSEQNPSNSQNAGLHQAKASSSLSNKKYSHPHNTTSEKEKVRSSLSLLKDNLHF